MWWWKQRCGSGNNETKELKNLFNSELAYALAEFECKDLTFVSAIYKQILKHWLTKSIDVII